MQLVATDMDGTLLNANHEISKRNKQTIQNLQERGIEVIAATGRNFPEAMAPVKQAGLSLPAICINGAEVRNEKGDIIATTHLLPEDIDQAMATLAKYDIYFDLYIQDNIYALSAEKQIDMFMQVGQSAKQIVPTEAIRESIMDRIGKGIIKEVDTYDAVLDKHKATVSKILGICHSDEQFERATKELQKSPQVAISSSGKGVIEINHTAAQKGIALQKYASLKGIDMKDVLVIGDNYNDVSMMERAGISVAMENAPDDIKAVCSHETASSDADGFALAIEAIL